MPPTKEIRCTNPDCEIDMFELHYTYDMPKDTPLEAFSCPHCGRTETLEVLEV